MKKIKKYLKEKIKKINEKIFNKKNNKIKFYEGIFRDTDFILPSYINLNNPNFIEIENIFYGGIIIVNYYREQTELLLKNLIDNNSNINISIFYEKQNTYKTINELTYHIGNVGADLKSGNENRQDIDIAAFTYNDAKYIRKEMQLNNEELFFLYIYLNVYAENEKDLKHLIEKIEGIAQSRGMQTRRANFRQEQAFISSLPIMKNEPSLKDAAKRNILTSGLISTYPFISSSLYDEEGIFIGTNIYNNSLVFIDRYNTEKYKNANMCVFGTSGAGKSFYTKLLILRGKLLGLEQYIIDPEKEYNILSENLGGTVVKLGATSNNYVNIFDIREESIEENENGYLATKIGKLIGFFNLIFGKIDEEEKAIIEEKLIEVYKNKGITFDDKSLFKIDGSFKNYRDMPILEDLYNVLGKNLETLKFRTKLIPFVKGSLNFFNNYTNIELNNDLIVADVYDLGEENLKYGMYLFTDVIYILLEPQ